MPQCAAMKIAQLCVMLLLPSAPLFAQKPNFEIRGYSLGETVQELFAKADRSNEPSECQKYVRSHKIKESLLASTKQMDINSEIKRCTQILLAMDGQRARFFFKYLMGDVQFADGKLSAIDITFMNSINPESQQIPFAKVLEDALSKYGEPQSTGTTTWQNGFGATFNPRYAEWTNDVFVLRIEELPKTSPSPFSADVNLTAVTKAEMKNSYRDKVAGPSVFDK